MRRSRRPLLVMHRDRVVRERIRKAGGSDYQIREIADWRDLRARVRHVVPAAVIVVDPYLPSNGHRSNGTHGPSPELRVLLADFPSIAVVAAMEVTPSRFEDVRRLGEWGIVQLICVGHDTTPFAIAQRLRAARGRPLRALVDEALPRTTPGRTRVLLETAADVVIREGGVEDLARLLNVSQRTLLRSCARAGLPAPRKLLAWLRLLLAAEMLDDPGRTILDVAMVCGYATDSGLRRVTQSYLGGSPSQLRDDGAFDRAARAFIDALIASGMSNGGDPR